MITNSYFSRPILVLTISSKDEQQYSEDRPNDHRRTDLCECVHARKQLEGKYHSLACSEDLKDRHQLAVGFQIGCSQVDQERHDQVAESVQHGCTAVRENDTESFFSSITNMVTGK